MVEYIVGSLIIIILSFPLYSEKIAEREIKRRIIKNHPGIKEVKVNLKNSHPFKILRGRVDNIFVSGGEVQVYGLLVSEFRVYIQKIVFSPQKAFFKKEIKIKDLKIGESQLIIKEKDFTKYLQKKTNRIKALKVDFKPNKFILSGKVKTFLILIPFQIEAEVEIKKEKEVHLYIPRAKLAFIPIPGFVLNIIFEDINPILNIEDEENLLELFLGVKDWREISYYPLVFCLKKIRTTEKEMIVEGYAHLAR